MNRSPVLFYGSAIATGICVGLLIVGIVEATKSSAPTTTPVVPPTNPVVVPPTVTVPVEPAPAPVVAPVVSPVDPAAPWDDWMAWHRPRCEQCTAAFNGASESICLESFQEMQRRGFKKQSAPPPLPAAPASLPGVCGPGGCGANSKATLNSSPQAEKPKQQTYQSAPRRGLFQRLFRGNR